jgi:sulfane dehydrogenase subunit SoxC
MSDESAKHVTRRRVLAGLAAGAGAAVAGRAVAGPAEGPGDFPARDESNSALGAAPSALGKRSPHEQPRRLAMLGAISGTPLQALHGTLTPADLHFERHHAGVPAIDPERHRLMVHGMVERPLAFTLADLIRFPSITRTCFIECSGNLHIAAGERTSPQALCGLTSQSEWTGVALSTLLREVGARPTASWLLAEGGDAALMTRSIPARKAWDDAIIAYAQNGEAIRPEQGYPVRLLLPGWEGNTHIKWLRRIELSDQPFMTREETAKYTDPLADGTARQFSVVMDARSVITHPTYPDRIEKGWHEIRGLAWTGRGRIRRVEVSVDAGRSWQATRLLGPVLPTAHTRFVLPWRWDGGETEIMSRAIDETGYVQPTRRALIDARGRGSIPYHLNSILAWRIAPDGEVLYRAEPWA